MKINYKHLCKAGAHTTSTALRIGLFLSIAHFSDKRPAPSLDRLGITDSSRGLIEKEIEQKKKEKLFA